MRLNASNQFLADLPGSEHFEDAGSHVYLMRLVPAVLVPDAQLGAVIKERLAAGGLAPRQHSVVERRQPPPVLVVWRCSQRQQDLHRDAALTME